MLVWAMATILPSNSDNTAITMIMPLQTSCRSPSASTRIRMVSANAAIFGADAMYSVTGERAP